MAKAIAYLESVRGVIDIIDRPIIVESDCNFGEGASQLEMVKINYSREF